MKIIFMGTPEFSAQILEKLIEKHEVLAVVTQPDKPKGRGKKMVFPPVKDCALAHNIPVLQPIKIRDPFFIEELAKYNADVFVVAAYGQILSQTILDMPKYRSINVHGSLLPKYRGAAPIQWAIINGETETGVTIMQMDKGIDTGDMLLKKSFDILPTDTSTEVYDKMAEVGSEALLEVLELAEKNQLVPIKQDDNLSSYAKLIDKKMGQINWQTNSQTIINLIRGLNPWPSAYTFYNEEMLKIWKAEVVSCMKNGVSGEIIDIINNEGIIVKTGDSALIIKEIQGMGGKKMSCSDFLRGHKLDIGVILGNNN